VTLPGRLCALFPAAHLAAISSCGLLLLASPSTARALGLLLVVYGVPLGLYRLLGLICPLREGISRLDAPRFSPWWGGHQLQALFIALPALEALLRLVPGLYSLWLRLWGSRIGRGVYWTPRVEVADRGLLEVGDRVIFGHRVAIYGHVVTPRSRGLVLYARRVMVGAGAFVGAGSRLGPGVRIAPGARVPLLSDLGPNRRVPACAADGAAAPPAPPRRRSLAALALAPALALALGPRAARFRRALRDPGAAQDRVLGTIVASLARTEYGRHHGLRPGDDYAAFRARLPVVTYDGLAPWIATQVRTEGRVLVAEPVRLYEKTSGSSGPAKLIPHPAALQRSFQHLFYLWLHDLLTSGPRLHTGRTWISISPGFGRAEVTERGVRVGRAHDLEYLQGWVGRMIRPFLALPPAAARLRDPGRWRHVAALALLAGEPEIVSVWNPSLLTVLLDHAATHRDELCRDWAAGRATVEGVDFRYRPGDRERLALLRRDPLDWPRLLPALRLISCWADRHARSAADRLRALFPAVRLQPKGLLATEAPMTLPLLDAGGAVPLVDEVFFELEDAAGAVLPLGAAVCGREYALVISTRGGLARYRIGDRVRVGEPYLGTPRLDFVGRDGAVADLVGEKLQEEFVKGALGRLPLDGSAFHALVPVRGGERPGRYVLLVDRAPVGAEALALALDSRLKESHGYRQARLLGQLDPPVVRIGADVEERFLRRAVERGRRWGDVKHRYLVTDPAEAVDLGAGAS
jgi:acetyltransferase-like isoleucine patch superfamily enzyme